MICTTLESIKLYFHIRAHKNHKTWFSSISTLSFTIFLLSFCKSLHWVMKMTQWIFIRNANTPTRIFPCEMNPKVLKCVCVCIFFCSIRESNCQWKWKWEFISHFHFTDEMHEKKWRVKTLEPNDTSNKFPNGSLIYETGN